MVEKKVIALFDVDGTLTPARKKVTKDILVALEKLRSKITIGFVGGSDLSKQREQLGENGRGLIIMIKLLSCYYFMYISCLVCFASHL